MKNTALILSTKPLLVIGLFFLSIPNNIHSQVQSEYYESGQLKVQTEILENGGEKVTSFYPNGKVQTKFITSFENGLQVGEFERFYSNGSKSAIGKYINGLKDGMHTRFYKNGIVVYTSVLWDNGTPINIVESNNNEIDSIAIQVFHDPYDRSIAIKGQTINNVKSGEWSTYYRPDEIETFSGIHKKTGYLVKSIGFMEENTMNGPWSFIDTNGNLTWEGNYKDGEKTGKWKYNKFYKSKSITAEGSFVNNQPYGVWKFAENYTNQKYVYELDFKSLNNYTINMYRTTSDGISETPKIKGEVIDGKFSGSYYPMGRFRETFHILYTDGEIKKVTHLDSNEGLQIFPYKNSDDIFTLDRLKSSINKWNNIHNNIITLWPSGSCDLRFNFPSVHFFEKK